MPIASPIGFLDVVNATLRSSQVETTSRLTVANTAATKNFSVGDRFHVDKDSVDPVSVTGNVVASGIKISNLTISPIFDLGAVSNVGNTTSNTLQFANATTGFTTTANVEIGGNITLTSNAQVKVGSNVLAEYTGPHGREPKEMPLKKFPEIAFEEGKFDHNTTTNTFVQAGYTITSSGNYSDDVNSQFTAWRAFTGKLNLYNPGWVSPFASYTSGVANSTQSLTNIDTATSTGSVSSRNGAWIKLELPTKIKLGRVDFYDRYDDSGTHTATGQERVSEAFVYGGNSNSGPWYEIGKQSDATNMAHYTDDNPASLTINTTSYYKYYIIQPTQLAKTLAYGSYGQLMFYGYEEPAPPGDLSLDTTLKSTFNSVRSNNYVMYFDGDGFIPGDNTSNNLVTGSSVSVVHHNATYDSTGKYWTLDGSTESNVTTGSLGLVGDAPHTVSTWINASNLDANATTQQLFSIGSGYSEEIVRVDDTQITANTWHNVTYAYQGEGGSKVTYVDGRKVEEAQVEDTFGDYPPFAMTDYEIGGYRVSASGELSLTDNSHNIFDKDISDSSLWTPSAYGYNSSTGAANSTGSITLTNGVQGHWVQLDLPHKLKLNYVGVAASSIGTRYAKDATIFGSNDGVSWTSVGGWTDNTHASNTLKYFTMNGDSGYYNKYRLVVTKNGPDAALTLTEWKLYGHKEGDLTRFPEPTRVLKYPHIAFPNSDGTAVGSNVAPSVRGYVATTDDANSSFPIGKVFDEKYQTSGSDAAQRWQPVGTHYASNGGVATSTNLTQTTLGNGTTYRGNYIQLESPHKLIITKYQIYSGAAVSTHRPTIVVLLGSNTGNTNDWVDLGSGDTTLPAYSGSDPNYSTTATISNTGAYKYHRLVIRAVHSTTLPVVFQVKFFGTEEDTGTPAIVGGPFAGKVANFRVYDQYLGDERIQEIYDAQKDEFGHKKSSMTLYKGRVGVGTTEPEGALTVIDEPHALAKFPARAVSADDSYVEGDGQIKLSAADGSGYQAFDGLTSTSWTATPTRNTRLSEEVDFGAWLKIQTPESVSLKKAEIESNPDWQQLGSTINDNAEHAATSATFGMALDCSDDGTRIIVGAYHADVGGSNRGQAFVFDWNGSEWVRVGNILQGTQDGEQLGYAVAISGDGNYIAVGSPLYHDSSIADVGRYTVMYLAGSTWTLLPDSGSLTSTLQNYFLGTSTDDRAGWSLSLSHDGKTIAAGYRQLASGAGGQAGQIRVHKYANGAWTQKGQNLNGLESDDRLGQSVKITPDGNHLIAGAPYGAKSEVYVYDYNSSTSQWDKRTTLTHPTSPNANTHFYGSGIAISDDGNTVAVGASLDDTGGTDYGRVYMYSWSGSAWTLVNTLVSTLQGTDNEQFGSAVDLSGDGTRLVAAAARENNQQGYAFTYEYTGGTWQLRNHATSGSAGVSTDGRLGEFYTGLIISRDGSTIVGGDRAGSESKARVWNMPSNIKSIWGSNDDVNWTKITTGNETFRRSDRLEFKNLDNPNYYKYHAIVADAFTRLKDVKLFGVRNQGSSTLHDGTLTLTKNLDVPRIGPPLDADDTPRRDRLVVEYNTSTNPVEDGLVQDTSGRGNDGVMTGSSYSATDKSLSSSGTTGEIRLGSLPTTTITQLSFSFWINPTGNSPILYHGYEAIGRRVSFNVDQSGVGLFFAISGNYIQNAACLTLGQWQHVSVVFSGGSIGASLSDGSVVYKLYIDGVDKGWTGGLFNAGTLQLENGHPFVLMNGVAGTTGTGAIKLSNFKYYDCTLTAEEVKTLYQMGRCDEGLGHVVNFSKTRVGIGLGDGEVPQAALDVRGVANFGDNVGIGTTSPIGKLDVRGAIMTPVISYSSNQDAPYLIAGTSGYTGAATNWNTHGFQHRIKTSSGGVPRITVDAQSGGEAFSIVNGGNIGIGTTNPAKKLHVEHYGSAIGDFEGIRIANHASLLHATVRPAYEFVVSDIESNTGIGNGTFAIGYRATTSASRTDRLVIDNSGNVGIGITNPPAKLFVKTTGGASMGGAWTTTDFVVSHGVGTTAPSRSLGVALGVDGTGNTGASKGYLWCMRPNLTWNTLKIQGNIIEIVGLASITSNRSITNTSDDRLKTEEEFLQNALPTIMKLKPQTYRKQPFLPNDPSKEVTENMTEMPSDLSKIETGLVVQDIWYDAPELRHLIKLGEDANPPEVRPVDPDPSDPTQDPDYSSWGTTATTLEYQGVFVVAIKAIQELNTELQAERVKVTTLESQLASVLTRLDALESA